MAMRRAYLLDASILPTTVKFSQYWPVSVEGFGDEYFILNSVCRRAIIIEYPVSSTPSPGSTPTIGNKQIQVIR